MNSGDVPPDCGSSGLAPHSIRMISCAVWIPERAQLPRTKYYMDAAATPFIRPDDGGPDVFVHMSAVQKARFKRAGFLSSQPRTIIVIDASEVVTSFSRANGRAGTLNSEGLR